MNEWMNIGLPDVEYCYGILSIRPMFDSALSYLRVGYSQT